MPIFFEGRPTEFDMVTDRERGVIGARPRHCILHSDGGVYGVFAEVVPNDNVPALAMSTGWPN